jgi:class 3 adenylate cyclase
LQPKQVRDRLLAHETEKNNKRKGDAMVTNNFKLKSFLNGLGDISTQHDQPIADLFPYCTVMFADISGFTAWSSAREPAQVFILLQTVYQSFDLIAKRRHVFKVETIGDSYVAVTGLPEPQTKHASIMARFAWDCLIRIGEVTKELESTLGPDTAALSMRFGLHSGAVTAGVLKGDRARFQLFGDTVNTAARMESTGIKGRIQVSSATAEALKKDNKEAWLTPRDDNVVAKGKGVMSTYWLGIKKAAQSIYSTEENAELDDKIPRGSCRAASDMDDKDARVVDWVCEMLVKQIKKVVVVHQRCPFHAHSKRNVDFQGEDGKICLDEVQEAIRTPDFKTEVAEATLDHDLVEIPEGIANDIRDYVAMIAASYKSNKFHNFEHACHVTMSVSKLLGRVVSPELSSMQGESVADQRARNHMAAQIHDFTHGLTSDPLASLALVFTALIHDVDHLGVSNVQLAKEQPELAGYYRNKSIAEQNSLDIAWDLLMTDRFKKLREYIFETQAELRRFRQLIVNMVLATDIFDKDFNQLRKDRWQRAFHENLPDSVTKDLRATIVMEHIIQASDVSHTMQHWHIYQKWNRRLFEEMSAAYKAGRMGSDPCTFWYKGELAFFDNYVIPLATKLKECNVFGVCSDEYLDYAMKNREEWNERGEEIVARMMAELQEH